jgi:hypothetical protein
VGKSSPSSQSSRDVQKQVQLGAMLCCKQLDMKEGISVISLFCFGPEKTLSILYPPETIINTCESNADDFRA